MKRSEAVEEIRKILALNGRDDGMGELEEAILHQLESVGMLPPSTYIKTFDKYDNVWDNEQDEIKI